MRSFHFAAFAALASLAGTACDGDVQVEASSSNTAAGGSGASGGSGGAAGSGAGGALPSTTTGTAGTGDTGPDIGKPSDMYPAAHPDLPKVAHYGGPVLAAPKVQPIYFSNDLDGFTDKLTDFTNKVGLTQYWKAVTEEYGVGPLTGLPPVKVAEAATGTITDADIQAWLADKLNSNSPEFAVPDDNTLYAIFYPPGLTISEQGSKSCSDFGGYHSNLQLDANHQYLEVPYAVMPRCPSFGGLQGIDAVTGTASHEYIEAATDPLPMTSPAYALTDDAHIYWVRALGGGETADLCAQDPDSFTTFDELPYVVQRSWSNKAAAEGHDPCVPQHAGDVYFNAAPVMNDTIVFGIGGFQTNVKGVKIAEGESKTIDVALFSDAPSDLINVKAYDYSALIGGQPRLSFNLDADKGLNGQTLHLEITVDSASKNNTELFLLISSIGDQQNWWVGVVGQ